MQTEDFNKTNFLLSELQAGKERAFDFIFRKYYKALCAQAMAYLKDLDTAQSLVQECFIKFWEYRQNANKINNLSSYLSFMVRNQCIDHIRKAKTLEERNEKIEHTGKAINPEELILAREFEERLVIALSSIPERSRIAFEYSRFENLSYKEIAQKMDISLKAVEALVSRALKILRTELKDYLPLILFLFKINRF